MTRSLVATLLSASMAFQLMLAAGGTMCVRSSDASASAGAEAAMAGMEMPSDESQPQPCDEAANPASCLTMAPCAVAAFVAADSPVAGLTHVLSRIGTTTARPESRSSAPEPPPPRA